MCSTNQIKECVKLASNQNVFQWYSNVMLHVHMYVCVYIDIYIYIYVCVCVKFDILLKQTVFLIGY